MKTIELLLLVLILYACESRPVESVIKGPVIKNAEDFKYGTTLIFQQAFADNVVVDKSGENQIWDFSKLEVIPSKTTTIKITPPDSTPYYNLFPEANFVEKYSDGRYVYLLKNEHENQLVGTVSTENNLFIKYNNPMLFIKRPIKFQDTISDEYTTEYSVNGMDFKGKGTVTTIADAYGTLILPNNKYENVLRVKVEQVQTDTLKQYSSIIKTVTITYLWFDNKHTSALLKVNETKSDYYKEKTIEFLLSETY